MKSEIVVILACFAVSVFSVSVNQCKSGVKPPKTVKVSGCEKQPCPLTRGSNVTLELTFVAPQYLTAINTQVIANALGVEIEYPLPEPDACKGLQNAKCPLEEGEEVVYKLVMPVLSAYPPISLGLTFSLQNEKKKDFSCFQINCKVVNP